MDCAEIFEVVSTAGLYFMFLEACFGLIAICLPTLSAVLKRDMLSNFVRGLSSLFSLRQRSRDNEAPWFDGHERTYTEPSVSARARQTSDVDDSMQSFELQNAKAIKMTDDIDQTQSMV